jgi:acyl carrier protein
MIDDEIRAVVATVAERDVASIDPEMPLAEAGIDSLMAMEIVVDIERRYRVRFADDELKAVDTLGDLTRLTVEKLATSEHRSNAP